MPERHDFVRKRTQDCARFARGENGSLLHEERRKRRLTVDLVTLIVCLSWFVGGFVSGVSGIGGAMVALPVVAMFLPMHETIVLTCLLNVIMDSCIAVMHFRHCRFSSLLPMLLGAVPGSVLGLYVLKVFSGEALQAGVGLVLLFFVYWQHHSRIQARGESRPLGCAAGFGAGLLGTSISFDGPPIAAYGLYAGWEPRVYLGTLGVFFVVRGLVTCVLQAGAGFYTPEVVHYACYAAPAVMLGTLLSFPVVRHIRVEVFRRVLMVIIAAAAIVCLLHPFM